MEQTSSKTKEPVDSVKSKSNGVGVEDSLRVRQGTLILGLDDGCILGSLSNFYFSPRSNKITAVVFREHGTLTHKFVTHEKVVRMGKDAIFVKSSQCATKFKADALVPPGKSLAEFKGRRVVTRGGVHIGQLKEAGVSLQTSKISILYLSNLQVLPVEAKEVVFGADEIIVRRGDEKRVILKPFKPEESIFSYFIDRNAMESLAKQVRNKWLGVSKTAQTRSVEEN